MQPQPFGKYTLLSRLGSGGMAEVFLARAESIGGFEKLLAIKRLLPSCTQDQETVDLLADEARITVRLTHPNIVQVFDFGRVDESYYIAMEYVDGLDLKSLIRIDELRSEPMELSLALYVTTCVLEALYFAHTQRDAGLSLGIIHRDVSPHNVLISRHGQVKITDFGVARAAISSHVTRVGDIRGKFSYMPPEQVCGGEIDHRVDVFAAGAVLYELLSGRQAYRAASAGEQLQLLRFDVQAPSAHRPELPHELDAICRRALDKDPARRYASAAEFAAALREQSVRLGAAALPPTGALAGLVEERLARMATEPPTGERSEVMSLGDYGAAGDSLIRGPRGEQARAARTRQTLRDRAEPGPASGASPPEAPRREDPLLALPTDVEDAPLASVRTASDPILPIEPGASPDPEDSETLVAFALPRELRDEAPARAEPPMEATPRRPPPRETRRPEHADATPVESEEGPTLALPALSPRAQPSRAAREDESLPPLRSSGGLDRRGRPAATSGHGRGRGQVAVVLVVAFIIGIALAVTLATC